MQAVHHVCRCSAMSNTSTVLNVMFKMHISTRVVYRLARSEQMETTLGLIHVNVYRLIYLPADTGCGNTDEDKNGSGLRTQRSDSEARVAFGIHDQK